LVDSIIAAHVGIRQIIDGIRLSRHLAICLTELPIDHFDSLNDEGILTGTLDWPPAFLFPVQLTFAEHLYKGWKSLSR